MSQQRTPLQTTASVQPADRSSFSRPFRLQLAGGVLIALLALMAYYPSLDGGFIFDDHVLLTDNPLIMAPDGFWRVWVNSSQPDYVPMTSSTLWLEWRLWGMNPTGYHVANLALHIAACLLLWLLLKSLSIPGAFLAALLYAIHPVNVESVAWVEQRKDTLSTVLALLSILGYIKSDFPSPSTANRLYPPGAGRWFWLALLSFVLAMFSKGSVATLPVLLLLVAWWKSGRLTVRDLLRSAPFFVVSAVLTPVIIWFVAHGTGVAPRDATIVQRALQAGAVVWFYLSKALAPIKLIFFYPLWNIQTSDLRWWLPLAAALVVSFLLVWRCLKSPHSNWVPALLFAWAFFCVALAPAMGFFDPGYMRFSLVADHYQHLALLAVVSLLAAGISTWHARVRDGLQAAVAAVAVVLVGSFTVLTWQQSHLYDNEIHMYEATLKENPDCWMAHINFGAALLTTGRSAESLQHMNEALRLAPESAEAQHNLANALAATGRPEEAIEHFKQALRLRPDYVKTYCNLGSVLLAAGRFEDAIANFQHALQLDPNYAEADYYLANALTRSGHPDEALAYYQQAVHINPNYAEAHNTLGSVLIQSGHLQEALDHYQQALRSKPDFAEAHNNLAIALASSGRASEAIEHFQQAIQLEPKKGDTHYNLGVILANTGRLPEAVDQLVEALRLDPSRLQAYAKLATAYAQLQRPADAIAAAEKGLETARASGQGQLAQQFENWLANYRAQPADSHDAPPRSEADRASAK